MQCCKLTPGCISSMAESSHGTESDTPSQIQPILELLVSAGFSDAGNPNIPVGEKLTSGLAWCITALESDVVSAACIDINSDDVEKRIEDALKLIKCPYAVEASQIRNVECEALFPVVQWLIRNIQTTKPQGNFCPGQFENELHDAETLVQSLNAELDKQKQQRVDLHNKLQRTQEKINQGANPSSASKLKSLVKSLKDLEKKEFVFNSDCDSKQSKLQAEIIELEEKVTSGCCSKKLSDDLNRSLSESLEKLNAAKMDLGSVLRTILSVKRQLDDIPCQSELIQYERRLSELNTHIQGKLRQTRKYYATYNALLEIKELMLKETSLLNSISSQFQDAISSQAGRAKLTDSMEGIVKGSQQKVEKVQQGLQEEQKICNALKERYAAAIAERRQCYSLLKAFQEECAKNEKLRSQGNL